MKSKRDLIVDAGEALFAVHGFDGVSMRMIATQAPVGLGLVTHHFPSKDQLFAEVVRRRANIINDARCVALATLECPGLEAVLHAFFQPYVDLIQTGEQGWRAYARLHAMLTQDARWSELAVSTFGAVAQQMIDRLIEVEPGLSRAAAVRGYVFVVGSMVNIFADTRLLDRLSGGEVSSNDVGGNIAPLVRFGAAGIKALVENDGKDRGD